MRISDWSSDVCSSDLFVTAATFLIDVIAVAIFVAIPLAALVILVESADDRAARRADSRAFHGAEARHHRADSGTASAADCSAPADLAFTPGKPDGEADGKYNEARSHPASPFNACSDGDPAYRPNSGFLVRSGTSGGHPYRALR